mmetsp:Transcript_3538/g.3477  ORF Transcript_3538/g.3477 Transcript_3538/m.3477 type:complete len:134 (+) Transcript_3538:353-754(+)
MSYKNIPTVIFSHPPIGVMGLSEEAAIKAYGKENIKVYKAKFTNMFYSLSTDDNLRQGTLFKVICNVEAAIPPAAPVERIAGLQLIGKGADEMLQGLSIAMIMGATKQDFDNVVAIHPTASEEFVTMDANFIM